MELITVTALKPRCGRCNEIVVPSELSLTTSHELLLAGYCSVCLKDVKILIPLGELYDNCPVSEDPEADNIRLRSLGISA